jgi:DNA-binding CsgD family transcriptional regulator/tetratricopeptide (TPR) repeat protein
MSGAQATPSRATTIRGTGGPADLGGPAGAPYSVPVGLLERDVEFDVLSGALAAALEGSGSGVAISGGPGAGKSVLVEAACATVPGLRVLRGCCDPLTTPRPLGPFRDLLAGLGSLDGQAPLADLCESIFAAVRSEPTVLVVEDLHWVDAASAEVLRFLLRRIEAMSCAIVVTYRYDEIGDQHSARPLLGDFAVLANLRTLALSPLSVDGVAAVLVDSHLDPARVHAVTGGNPFFVTEVAKEPDLALPSTVRDAVLARTAGIAPADFEVLQLAASAPDRLDDRLLPALGVDLPTLRRLHATGLLLRNRGGIVFRHELARLAVESTIPVGGLARLHARLLEALERIEPRDPAVLTHHAVAAADSVRATRYGIAAADEAARTGSHTEAVAFLQTALSHLDGRRPHERAALLIKLANEQYMTSRLSSAIQSVTETFPLWHEVGDAAGLSAAHDSAAVFEYYNARRRQAEDHAARAAQFAGDSELEYGTARMTRGYLAFQRGDYDLAVACSTEADRIAGELGDEPLGIRSGIVTAAKDLALGVVGARERLVDLVEEARARGLDELASTGQSNLSYLDVDQRRLPAAERVLEDSIRFTLEREIPICNHWQTGVRSRLRFIEGRWSAALEDAEDALARTGMPMATVWPHLVSGLVGLRRDGSPGDHLEAAWHVADRLDEPLRRLPVLSGMAERMWLTGEPDDLVTATAPAALEQAAGSPATAWVVGDLAMWLTRLGLAPELDLSEVADPFRLTLSGRHAEAASLWRQVGGVFEEAMAYADSPDDALRTRAVERLDLLGATAVADRLRRALREEGVAQVPPRPRVSTRANPAGLTNRQLEVAKLVARGFTNAEIAERLFISSKTADHHVSAVLMKLGMQNRRAVVVQAAELGLS